MCPRLQMDRAYSSDPREHIAAAVLARTSGWPPHRGALIESVSRSVSRDPALGHGDGHRAADTRGLLGLRQRDSLFDRRQDGGVGIGRQDGAALGRGDGSRSAVARGS